MESNHLPSGYEPPALTDELHPRVLFRLTDESISDFTVTYIIDLVQGNSKIQKTGYRFCTTSQRFTFCWPSAFCDHCITDELEWY